VTVSASRPGVAGPGGVRIPRPAVALVVVCLISAGCAGSAADREGQDTEVAGVLIERQAPSPTLTDGGGVDIDAGDAVAVRCEGRFDHT